MFHRDSKPKIRLNAKRLKDLNEVLSPKRLLDNDKRQELINNIKSSSGFSDSQFTSLVQTLLHNYVNYCQSLPETSNAFYTDECGLLDHALNRTEAALSLFSEYVVDDGSGFSEIQKLWCYVLLSAGILQGVGKLILEFNVNLYDFHGKKLHKWNPLLESLVKVGSYFDYEFENAENDKFRKRLNLLMAKTIMPKDGYEWIASDKEVLANWLALLNEDYDEAGTLGAILIRADAIALQRYFNKFLVRINSSRGKLQRIKAFVEKTPEALADKEKIIGSEFINWLMNQLESRKIYLNKAPLYMVPGGLIMSTEMFKWFVREHPEYKSWQAIQKALLSLELHQENPDGSAISRFEQSKNHQIVSGVVLKDYAVALPEKVEVYDPNSGTHQELTPVEVIHKAQVNSDFSNRYQSQVAPTVSMLQANGRWVPNDSVINNNTLSSKQRG